MKAAQWHAAVSFNGPLHHWHLHGGHHKWYSNVFRCVLLSKAGVLENDGATAGSSLKLVMWGMDGE